MAPTSQSIAAPAPAKTAPGPRREKICPCCGRSFGCHAGGCWCEAVEADAAVRAVLRTRYRGCLCADCLRRLAAAGALSGTGTAVPPVRPKRHAPIRALWRPGRGATIHALRGRQARNAAVVPVARSRVGFRRATMISVAAHAALLAGWVLTPSPAWVTPPVPLAMASERVGLRLRLTSGDGAGDGHAAAGAAAEPAPLGSQSATRPPLQAMIQPSVPPWPRPANALSADAAISEQAQWLAAAIADSSLPGPAGAGAGGLADGRADAGGGGRGALAGGAEGTGRGGVGDGGGGDGRPGYLHNPAPPYPRLAREHGWEGTTLLRVEVRADGTSGRIEVVKSSGYPVLDETATNTVARWRFWPARSGASAVAAMVEIPISFRMVTAAAAPPAWPAPNGTAVISLAAVP